MNAISDPAQPEPPRHRRRLIAAAAAAMLAAGGLGTGLAGAFSGSPSHPASPYSSTGSSAGYSYYQQVMGRYGIRGGSMMGGPGYGWMMGPSGYGWMMGGTAAPGWMTGGTLPGFMMGSGTEPGTAMGSLFADAPGPRVSTAEATRLGNQVPAGATADRSANTVAFATANVALTVLASPSMPAENFKIAGMTNPTISVPAGAKVTIEFINADGDMAHGLVVTSSGAAASVMPMITAAPAFPGAAVWSSERPPRPGCTKRRSPSPPPPRAATSISAPCPATPKRGWSAPSRSDERADTMTTRSRPRNSRIPQRPGGRRAAQRAACQRRFAVGLHRMERSSHLQPESGRCSPTSPTP